MRRSRNKRPFSPSSAAFLRYCNNCPSQKKKRPIHRILMPRKCWLNAIKKRYPKSHPSLKVDRELGCMKASLTSPYPSPSFLSYKKNPSKKTFSFPSITKTLDLCNGVKRKRKTKKQKKKKKHPLLRMRSQDSFQGAALRENSFFHYHVQIFSVSSAPALSIKTGWASFYPLFSFEAC